MKTLFYSLCIISSYVLGYVNESLASPFNPTEPKIIIHNEILTKVNDTVISVMDVVKEMNIIFLQTYPQLTDNMTAKYQFYCSSWKPVLEQMINKELMLLDSEGKLEVSEGEVREELEKKFGPNIMQNLDKLNLTFEEAKEKIKREIIFQRMSWYFIQNRAVQSVTPTDIKNAYQEYLKNNPPKTEWVYQVITIRSNKEEKAKQLAQKITHFIQEKNEDLSEIGPKILELQEEKGTIRISELLTNNSSEISENHKSALEPLNIGQYSHFFQAHNTRNSTPTFRIFYLKNKTITNPESFTNMTEKLKNTLVQKIIVKENDQYISRIRKQYAIGSNNLLVPEDFTPFSMQ